MGENFVQFYSDLLAPELLNQQRTWASSLARKPEPGRFAGKNKYIGRVKIPQWHDSQKPSRRN